MHFLETGRQNLRFRRQNPTTQPSRLFQDVETNAIISQDSSTFILLIVTVTVIINRWHIRMLASGIEMKLSSIKIIAEASLATSVPAIPIGKPDLATELPEPLFHSNWMDSQPDVFHPSTPAILDAGPSLMPSPVTEVLPRVWLWGCSQSCSTIWELAHHGNLKTICSFETGAFIHQAFRYVRILQPPAC